MAEFFDNAYDFVFTANDVIGQARQFYENLKAAGETVGTFYNWFNSANNRMFKTGNLRGSNVMPGPWNRWGTGYKKANQFKAITQLPHTAAFKEYMFKGPKKHEFHKLKVPRSLKQAYKPLTILGYREMDISPAVNGQAGNAYFNILPTRELLTCKLISQQHISKQINQSGANMGMNSWTSVIHKDTHKFTIANAANQPVVCEIYVFVYKDDDSTSFHSWLDFTEYEEGDTTHNGMMTVDKVGIVIAKENPRFDPVRHRKSIQANYRLIDKRRLALGPGQNTDYTYSQSGDLLISNTRLDEVIEATYATVNSIMPTSVTYGRDYLRGYTKVVLFRTYCALLSEDSGLNANLGTSDDIGTGKAKLLVREQLTRTIGCYPITRGHVGHPSADIILDNVTINANHGGHSVQRGTTGVFDFYGNYKEINGNSSFIDVEDDDAKNGGTTT